MPVADSATVIDAVFRIEFARLAVIGIAVHALVEWLTGKIVERRRRAWIAAQQERQAVGPYAAAPDEPYTAGYAPPPTTPPGPPR